MSKTDGGYRVFVVRRNKTFSLVFKDLVSGEVWLHRPSNKGTVFSAGLMATDDAVRALMAKHTGGHITRWSAEREGRSQGHTDVQRCKRWDVDVPALSGRWYKR